METMETTRNWTQQAISWLGNKSVPRRRAIVVLSLIAGWVAAGFVWSVVTRFGNVYSDAIDLKSHVKNETFDYRVVQDDWRFRMKWLPDDAGQMQCSVFWAGRLVALLVMSTENQNLVLRANLPPHERKEVEQRLGKAGVSNFQPMLVVRDSSFLTPWAKDILVELPRGSVEPWVRSYVGGVLKGMGVEYENKALRSLSQRIAGDIREKGHLDEIYSALTWPQFALGPVQYTTFVVFFASFLLIVLGLVATWLIAPARALTEVVPFVGFFGTLIGMGGALGILGDANLADELSKAMGLGPIGSQLSVAIETTKFALMLFLVLKLFDVMVSRGREIEGLREKP